MKISEIKGAITEIRVLRSAIGNIENMAAVKLIPDLSWPAMQNEQSRHLAEKAAFQVLKDNFTVASWKTQVLAKLQAKLDLLEDKFPFDIEEG